MTMSSDDATLRSTVFSIITKLLEDASVVVQDATPLIGDTSVLDSMRLVELCLGLEDYAAQQGFEFDWTSEAAMSRSRSIFRTAGALADELIRQSRAQA